MTLKTLHGNFVFLEQRFTRADGSGEVRYFELSGEFADGYESARLREFSAYYSNRLSYEEVARLVERVSGRRQVSDQRIWQGVVEKACEVSQDWAAAADAATQAWAMPVVAPVVDIYDVQQREVLVLADAIQVKGQPAQRQRQSRETPEISDSSDSSATSASGLWVSTDVLMLEQANGSFKYLTAGLARDGAAAVSVEALARANLSEQYGGRQDAPALPVVAITDGARVIRTQLLAIFGVLITVILDWYHLEKKVWELMSMIARNKQEKEPHVACLLAHLWHGEVRQAQAYLRTEVTARNEAKRQELLGYLEKHAAEIIDYERRQQAGKCVGSGRMEKGVDQVIGQRQKKKGMSWSRVGSKALGILKVVELNHAWEQTWFPQQAAA